MKGRFSRLWLLAIAIIFFAVPNLFSQNSMNSGVRYEKNVKYVNGYRVVKGDRPPIDLNEVHVSAYESGKILIKFNRDMNKFLSSPEVKANDNRVVTTGNDGFDRLNKAYKISKYRQTISNLYKVDPNSKGHKARHEAWGFDLWYEVTMDNSSNVKQAVADFSALKEIELAEPVYKKRKIEPVEVKPIQKSIQTKTSPNDEFYNLLWGLNNTGQQINNVAGTAGADIAAEAAWEIEKGNSNVIVSVHDGGVQFDHPDLAANMWPNIGPDGTNTIPDDHGTHVSGTIAGITNNEIGIAGIAGGDGSGNGVRIMSLDIFSGSLSTYQGFVYAADNGSSISQNSWGYENPDVYNTPDLEGIYYFNENGGGDALLGGGIVIFAAGNDNDDGKWYPAYDNSTIAVASFDNLGRRSSFSNYGTWVDISAPGTNIASTATGSQYVWMSGTSMACPHVSGVAALVLSKYYGNITKEQLWNAILDGVEDIYAYNPSNIGTLGTGSTSAHKALFEASKRFFPKVLTSEVEVLSAYNANSGGVVIRDGGFPITAKGIVWSKDKNPTLDNCEGFTNDGTGTEKYISELNNLTVNTVYYVRAYATNSQGTSYGESIVFETFAEILVQVVGVNNAPIENAVVTMGEITKNTDNTGMALFYKPRGNHSYSISENTYLTTGGSFYVNTGENLLRAKLLPLNSEGVIIGESNVCYNSETIYRIANIVEEGSWEVVGGRIAKHISENVIIVSWGFSEEQRVLRYRFFNDDDFTLAYQQLVNLDENKVLAAAEKPRIHKKGDIPILICTTPDIEYQWYKDGLPIDGQTQQHFAPRNQPGNYQVQTIDSKQCPNTSSAMDVTAVMELGTIATYPNPSNGDFTINYSSQLTGNGLITVANAQGEVVYQEVVSKPQEILSQRLTLSELPRGIYIVRVSIGNEAPVTSKISIR